MKEKTLYISLGSNIGNKALHLQRAVFAINDSIGEVQRTSAFIIRRPRILTEMIL